MKADGAWFTVRRRAYGLVFLLVPALLIWLSIKMYDKSFTDVDTVTLRTGTVGNEMHVYADVKLRGVVVGEVREIAADGNGAKLTLAMQPDKMRWIPADVRAQMLPTTLFGQRYVALIPPAGPAAYGSGGTRLAAGAVIPEDRSKNAIELQQVLDNSLPLLTAVQPAKLSSTLTALAQALDGRGKQLGETLVELDAYLKKLNPQLPTLNRNIQELVKFAHHYSQIAPDAVDALAAATTFTRTVLSQRENLNELYRTITGATQDLRTFLAENRDNVIDLAGHSRPSLEVLAKYAPEFPCLFSTLNGFIPKMNKALGQGTKRHGIHVDITAVPSKGRYVPGRDRPVYRARGGPQCYPVPFRGAAGHAATRAAPVNATGPVAVPPGSLGLPNSRQENEFVNELLAPGLQDVPQALPGWSSVLVGPVYRGAEVSLK